MKRIFTTISVIFSTFLIGNFFLAQNYKYDSSAIQAFEESLSFLNSKNYIHVNSNAYSTHIFNTGDKISKHRNSSISIQKPNTLIVDLHENDESLTIIFNNGSLQYESVSGQFQSEIKMESNDLNDFLEKCNKYPSLESPVSKILSEKQYLSTCNNMIGAIDLGMDNINNIQTKHILIITSQENYEMWLNPMENYLPLKLILTDKTKNGNPTYSVELNNWEFDASKMTMLNLYNHSSSIPNIND